MLFPMWVIAQETSGKGQGFIQGNVLDDKVDPLSGATISLQQLADSNWKKAVSGDKDGRFAFYDIPFAYYRLQVSAVGFGLLVLDSIHVREGRSEFILSDLKLVRTASKLQEVIVYAEKPLLQSKDGNIVFNAAESPASAGSNASDLLKGLPLVAIDPDGKITVKGKEPKVLIDDKPIELNAQQLQDFLESLPGSMIERIEVMTNPPPQYAHEPGGVINIITRKGRVGRTGRLQMYAGTRGESGISGNFNYRKKTFSLNLNGGYGYSLYEGLGYSRRTNYFIDTVTYLHIDNQYANRNRQPHLRLNIDGEFNPQHLISVVVQYNENNMLNRSRIRFAQLDGGKDTSQYSLRDIFLEGVNRNPSAQFTYTHKGKQPGNLFRVFVNANYSTSGNDRHFTQRYLALPLLTPLGPDSLQQQRTDNTSKGLSMRYAYDHASPNKKTFFSSGAYYAYSSSRIQLLSLAFDRGATTYIPLPLLSNDFLFHQRILNVRLSVKQMLGPLTSISSGCNYEWTDLHFDLYHLKQTAGNQYANFMPFINFSHEWEEQLRLTVSYRRSIRRPGIGELNPSIDFADPYNLRFGNTKLQPTISHVLDGIVGRNTDEYFWNLGLNYNVVQDVFAQIRQLQPDGRTFVSWQNIDDRVEYGISTWNGYTFSKQFRVNANVSYTYNQYSLRDRTMLRYRNGASLTSGLNSSWMPTDHWNIQGGFTFNRFASPQGYVRWNSSMNVGIQHKFFSKRLVLTANIIDPLRQQINRTFTNGVNFQHESYSLNRTRNYRLSVTYNFNASLKKQATDVDTERQRIMKMVPRKPLKG